MKYLNKYRVSAWTTDWFGWNEIYIDNSYILFFKLRSQEPFLSIQLLKAGPRDVIVNAFIRKKDTSGMLLRKPGEMDKLKRQLVTDFCKE